MKKILSYISLLTIISLTSLSLVNAGSHEKKTTTAETSTEAEPKSTESAETETETDNKKEEEEPDCE